MDADKKKALDMAMHQIEKDFGKGSIMKLGEASAKMNIAVNLQKDSFKDRDPSVLVFVLFFLRGAFWERLFLLWSRCLSSV